jgi:hypothetical protein
VGVHLEYPIALNTAVKTLDVSLDVFNLFDRQTGVDYEYQSELGGTVNPPPGLGIEPCPECADPDFGKPTDYQDPQQILLALRAHF